MVIDVGPTSVKLIRRGTAQVVVRCAMEAPTVWHLTTNRNALWLFIVLLALWKQGNETGCTARISLSFCDWAWVVVLEQIECFWNIYARVRVTGSYND